MKEHPILFNGEMVRAILDGRKTQTRRVVLPPLNLTEDVARVEVKGAVWHGLTNDGETVALLWRLPKYNVGDHLWVRETHIHKASGTIYRADVDACEAAGLGGMYGGWKPSIFMRRVDSRITLEVTGVRCERVRDICGADAVAEGIAAAPEVAVMGYQQLWDKLNAKRGFGWDTNPWVWIYEFRRL